MLYKYSPIRKIMIVLMFLTTAVIMAGCHNNDDFAPYTSFIDELDEAFESDGFTSLYEIVLVADNIAARYAEDLILSEILFDTTDFARPRRIEFFYAKVHETRNQATSVQLSFYAEHNKFFRASFRQGHGRRVNVMATPIPDSYINRSFEELFSFAYAQHEGADAVTVALSFLGIRSVMSGKILLPHTPS